MRPACALHPLQSFRIACAPQELGHGVHLLASWPPKRALPVSLNTHLNGDVRDVHAVLAVTLKVDPQVAFKAGHTKELPQGLDFGQP